MSRAKKYDRSVICFDMNMESVNAENSLKAFNYLLYMKQLVPTNQNDLMKFIVFNTEHTHGERNMYIPYSTFILYKDFNKEALTGNKPKASNWISAIKTAVVSLCDECNEKQLYTLQLIIFTDLSTPLNPEDNAHIDSLIQIIQSHSIYLYILGPDVIKPHYITSVEDIQNWSQNIRYKNEAGCKFTKDAIAKLAGECEGIICDPFLGIELVEIYRATKGKVEWKCPLAIGHTNIELNTTTSRCVDLFSNPKISATVKAKSKFMTDGKEIPSDEVINAFRIDQKIIVVPKDVKENYVKDYNGPRMFKLVAFVSRDSIPEVYIIGGEAHTIEIPAESTDAHALQTLIHTCHKMNRCALVWRAYMSNNCPRLYVLYAHVAPTCHFYMVPLANSIDIHLPFRGATDIKQLPNGDSNTEYYKNVTNYLELLRAEGNKPVLHPMLTSGPWLTCFLQRVNYLERRRNGEISDNEALPQLDLGRTSVDVDKASEIKEFIKNHLKQKNKEELPKMNVNEDNGNDDDW